MNLQKTFFERIQEDRHAEDENFAQELARFLNISETSAYRRINGSTPLTFNELQRVAKYYEVTLDEHFELDGERIDPEVNFSWKYGKDAEQAYLGFLKWLLNDLEQTDAEHSRVIFHAKDFPVFFNFIYPEIGEFKSFFWQKTFIRIERFRSIKFSCKKLSGESSKLGKRIFSKYAELASMELWNNEVLTSILKQIKYAHEADFLMSKQDTIVLMRRLRQMVLHIQEMAEEGRKFLPGNPKVGGGSFELYHNDVILGDNSIILEGRGQRRMYISQNIIQGLITNDQHFVDNSYMMKANLFKNSLLLSNSAEKERVKFFGTLLNKIACVADELEIKLN
ncbi:MAG: helix-turn-helix domain-containing protein [Cytophagales bacterium]|nr:helix-turn-helix domain-containing protein [Cytophagales bacterium]